MANPVFETMTRLRIGEFKIRVWREESEFRMGPDIEVIDSIQYLTRCGNGYRGEDIAKAIAKLPRIAAVEVLRDSGDGGLFYPDWR